MSDETEVLAEIAEKADNLLVATALPMSAEIHLEGLTGGLKAIRRIALDALPEDHELRTGWRSKGG